MTFWIIFLLSVYNYLNLLEYYNALTRPQNSTRMFEWTSGFHFFELFAARGIEIFRIPFS